MPNQAFNPLKKHLFFLFFLILPFVATAQLDTIISRLDFESDFRFRIEQDWDSRKSDGSFREDRTRLRYRLRAGVTYEDKWYEVGFRVRTGNPRKQQDPQLTLGDGSKEFGTLPIGIEKAYFQGNWKRFSFWVGKNTFPFEKSNELFWSDNVFPEGVTIKQGIKPNSGFIDSIDLSAGHYIVTTSNTSFDKDAYFQGYQISTSLLNQRLTIFPSMYLFKNMPNIPDGNDTFLLDYSVLHLGTRFNILDKTLLNLEFDYYHNLQDYQDNGSITNQFKDEKSGIVVGLKYGHLKSKGDWFFSGTYTQLEQYSAVDFLAQNDWARWDYSSFGSPDGRLTNMKGLELVAGHKISKKINLIIKYYLVEQLIPYGIAKETGSRIRLDLDVKF